MRADHEISWILEGRSPDQIPMARLAEYMQQLATLFGQVESVHFDRIEKACTKIIARVEPGGASHKVQARVYAVRDHRAPPDAMRAERRINEMVAEDKGAARITFGASSILRFPGKINATEKPFSVVDQATLTGKLYALSEEPTGGIRARIRPRGGNNYVACTADRHVGATLRNFFLETVRVQGCGTWQRTNTGEWSCQALHIQSVFPVKDVTLRDALNRLREIEVEWPDDPLAEWTVLDEQDGAA